MQDTEKQAVIIVTGGTGGHIFPAKSLANSLADQKIKVIIFGDKNYQKYHKDADNYGYKIISSSKINKTIANLITAPIKILLGILQSVFWIALNRAKIIVAFGGYTTFPTLIAAVILGKTIILHEQNAHLGKVNHLFAKFADLIVTSYPETSGIGQNFSSKVRYVGNPVREEIAELSKLSYLLPSTQEQKPKAVENLGYDVLLASQFRHQAVQKINPEQEFNILIIGGSGGAKIFSEIIPKAFFNIKPELKNYLNIVQQCRKEYLEYTFEQYKSFNLNILVSSFENMEEQIKKAHLVISRAGSSSIAEFTAARKPLILVPFALASDNHQEKNALYIEKMGGAIVIKEKDFTINRLTKIIENLVDNPEVLLRMSANSFACAKLNAVNDFASLIKNYL